MKRILILSFLLILSFCTKEDNSGLENQLASLRAQNTTLLAELNTLKSLASQVPQLQASLNEALASYNNLEVSLNQVNANYNNSLALIQQLEVDIENIRSSFDLFVDEINQVFTKLNPSTENTFYWTNLMDENNEVLYAMMFEFGRSYTPSSSRLTLYSFDYPFVPIFNVYSWNGTCWNLKPELSLTNGGNTYIEAAANGNPLSTLKIYNTTITSQSLGLVSGSNNQSIRLYFYHNLNKTDPFSVAAQVFDSESNDYPDASLTTILHEDISSYQYSIAVSEICPD